jgi:hypothetical protein
MGAIFSYVVKKFCQKCPSVVERDEASITVIPIPVVFLNVKFQDDVS